MCIRDRIAHRIRWDGVLPFDVQLPAGFRGQNHFKSQPGEELMPEGEIFVHIEAHRQTDLSPFARHAFQTLQAFVLILINVWDILGFSLSQGTFTSVARNKFPAAAKLIDGQMTVVAA